MCVDFIFTPTPQHNRTYLNLNLPKLFLFLVVKLGVVSEEAVVAELLTSVALQIFCNLGFGLDAFLELEDEIVFA